MNKYVKTFGGWVKSSTGERVDNRLFIDELDWLWDTLYYQTTIKCNVEPVDVALTFVRRNLVTVKKDAIHYYSFPAFRAPEPIVRAIQQEALNAICAAFGVPSKYFEGQRP